MGKINLNKLITLVLLLTLLVSCSNSEYENRDNLKKSNQSDCQIQFMQMGQNPTIAEGANSFYHISGKFLYSISKKDGKVRVLDNNPDTLDDREENPELRKLSNAYFEFPVSVQYIDGKLYVVSKEAKNLENGIESEGNIYENIVYEVDTSGSGRKAIFKSEKDVNAIILHRGYLYFSTSDFYDIKLALIEGKKTDYKKLGYKLQRLPLHNLSAKPETIYERTNKLGYINQMLPIDNIMYFMEANTAIDYNKIQEEKKKINKGYILDYELNFQSLNLISKANKVLNTDGSNLSWPMPSSEKELIYTKNYGKLGMNEIREIIEKGKKFPEVERKLISTDYETNKIKEIDFHLPAEDSGLIFGYGDYFCVDNAMTSKMLKKPRTLKFFNKNAELVDEIELFARAGLVLGMDKNYLYINVLKLEDEELNGIYRLNLDNVGKGKLSWEKFFTYQPEVNANKK